MGGRAARGPGPARAAARRGWRGGGGRGGSGRGSHLKSLSLDVIFSRRLEMWYEALAMLTDLAGGGEGEEE